mgnify:FL=1
MFFKKKNSIVEENVAKQGIKKMDHVVTGLLLWWIIASIYGVKKLRGKEHSSEHDEKNHHEEEHHEPSEKKNQSILSRIFFGNK